MVKILPTLVLALMAFVLGAVFFSTRGPEGVVKNVPVPKPEEGGTDLATFAAYLEANREAIPGKGKPTEGVEHEHPQWRGPDRDGIIKDPVPISTDWGADGPPKLWEMEIAKGHAGVAVHDGRIIFTDYESDIFPVIDKETEEQKVNNKGEPVFTGGDVVRAISVDTAEEIWRFEYPVKVKTNHGFTRSTPCVNDEHIVSVGPKGHVVCLDSATGKLRWWKSLYHQYNSVIPKWYLAQSPIFDGPEHVILAPCGNGNEEHPERNALLMKVSCETGEVVWHSANPLQWEMTHVSIVPMDLDGRKTYLYIGHQGVVAVAADTGEIMWLSTKWEVKIAACASPVPLPDNRVFLSGGYGAGSMMMKINRVEGGTYPYDAEVLYKLPPKIFGSVHHTPIYHDGVIYGVRPSPNFDLICLEPEDGTVRWGAGTAHKFDMGHYFLAGSHIFAMNNDGLLTLVKLSKDKFKPLTSAQVVPGADSWGPMTLVDRRLIVRDLDTMACYDVGAQ